MLRLEGIPEVQPGDDLASFISESIRQNGIRVAHSDLFVVTHKIISKAERRLVQLESVTPPEKAAGWAQEWLRNPRVIELALLFSKDQIASRNTCHGLEYGPCVRH
jgi:coenzyme F420-0:L-glutamate ligase/coenzyme F420-1:gamma-L-glutamate ligase